MAKIREKKDMEQKNKVQMALWTGILCSMAPLSLFADNEWVGSVTSDLNTAANWSEGSVPLTTDEAVFNSAVSGVNFNPTASANFAVSTLNFPDSAQDFSFTFTNAKLTLSGGGITGSNTDTTIALTNTNNILASSQMSLTTVPSSIGSAIINITNIGSSAVSTISGDQIQSANDFSMLSGGSFTVENIGGNTGSLASSNIGTIESNQVQLYEGTLTENNALTISNTGINSGTGSSNFIGAVSTGQQLYTEFALTTSGSVTINISNSGTNSGSGHANTVGHVNGNQYFCSGTSLDAGDGFTLSATNIGTDSSSGTGSNEVGFINANQLQFSSSFITLDSATVRVSNSGTNTGAGTSNQIGVLSNAGCQIFIESTLQAGNSLSLALTNSGEDNSTGAGSNSVGVIAGSQLQLGNTFTALDDTSIVISNSGISDTIGTSSATGYLGASQLRAAGGVNAGDNYFLEVINSGTRSSSGGTLDVGYVDNFQVDISGAIVLGDSATIEIFNSGINSGTGTGNFIGYPAEGQLFFGASFLAGDSLTFVVNNTGNDTGTGSVTNHVGYSNGIQLKGITTFTVGNSAVIQVSNSGTNTNTSSSSFVGVINGAQAVFEGAFTAGTGLTFTAFNSKTNAGGSATVGECVSQVQFQSTCTMGDGSSITASNALGTVSDQQILFDSGFAVTSGSVTIVIENTGTVSGSQVELIDFTLTSGLATIHAINSGTVTGHGIFVHGDSSGGDVTINLADSSLYVDTTASGFTIGALNGSGTVQVNVPLTISTDKSVIATFTGVIENFSGASSLIKAGLGTQILTGTSTYTGKTYVNAGALVVNGNIVSSGDPIVAGGALLSGTGTVGTADVSGAIKGGNPLGTLTVSGDLIMEQGSYFGTVITPGSRSLVDVTGSVTIDPNTTYVIAFSPGSYNNTSTVVLTGSSISGVFDAVDVNGIGANFLTANITYTTTDVILGLKERSVVSLASGSNAVQVAGALDNAVLFNRTNVTYTIEPGPVITASPTPQLADVLISLLPLTTDKGITYALTQLQPAQLKGLTITQENNAVRVRESLSQRFVNVLEAQNCAENNPCCSHDKERMTAWVDGFGDTLVQDNETNASGLLTGYRANTGGVVTGFDWMFAECFYVGALGAYTHSHLHFKDGKGTGDISTGYAGVYLSMIADMLYANASTLGSWSDYRVDRHIEYATTNLTAKSDHGGNQFLAHLDTGLNLNYEGLTIRPFDSFDYMTQTERGYAESNAGEWELTIRRKNAIMMRNELGLQFEKCYCFARSKWIVSPKFSWVREVRIKGGSFDVKFTQGGTPFAIDGYFPDRSLFAPGLALTGMMLQDALTFDLYYDGEFTGGYSSNNFGGQVGYSF